MLEVEVARHPNLECQNYEEAWSLYLESHFETPSAYFGWILKRFRPEQSVQQYDTDGRYSLHITCFLSLSLVPKASQSQLLFLHPMVSDQGSSTHLSTLHSCHSSCVSVLLSTDDWRIGTVGHSVYGMRSGLNINGQISIGIGVKHIFPHPRAGLFIWNGCFLWHTFTRLPDSIQDFPD